MIDRLTAVQRRAVALVLAVLLVVLFYVMLLDPVAEKYRHYDDKIAELSYRLHQYETLAKGRASHQRLLDQVKRRDLAKQYYLAKRKPALASAELQQRVKRVVDRSEGKLISTQVVRGRRGDRSPEVTVKVRMRGDIRALQKVLYTLETSRPILFLDNVVIQAGPARRRAGSSGQSGGKQLTINFDVIGYTREQSG